MLPVAPVRGASLRLRDGTRLDADIWAPEAPGRFPVLLMRQPYGRRIASTVVYAHPAWYAAQGYVVVIQDVRGAGTSEGVFRLFADDAADGAESVAWARDLPGSNGRLGMYGFSYQGNTQLLALAGGGAPDALAPCMAGWDLRGDWAWENGAMPFSAGLGWGCQMGWLRATHDGDAEAATAFRAAARALPLAESRRTLPAVMQRFGHLTHYPDWLRNPEPAPYWDAIAPRARLAECAAPPPMLHVGGWQDQMLMGTLDGREALAARAGGPQALVVGPWTHLPWGRRVGAADLGPAASSPIDAMQVAFFDRHLKGLGEAAPALRLFDIGARTWARFAEWPETEARSLFLGGTGLAAATCTDGVLRDSPAAPGVEWFVHDPWRPVPSLGGPVAQPGGTQDRAALDDRSDVACFTGTPLAAPLTLCGRITAEIMAEADQPSFDLSVVLSIVSPDGRTMTLAHGHARCDAPGLIRVPLRATLCTVPAGHALRLSVAGAAYPAYAVNPGTGAAVADYRAEEERIITIALRHGGASGSRLVLPVLR